nr:unnamed protein product [Callosobruchus analis]
MLSKVGELCRTKAQKRPYPERSKFTNNRKMKFASRVNYVDRSDELGNESDGGNTSQNYDCFKLNHRTAPNKKEQEQNELIECYVGGIPVKLLIDSVLRRILLMALTGNIYDQDRRYCGM